MTGSTLSGIFPSPRFCRQQAIVNLQKTPKDARAEIVIHAKIDAVMRCVMQELGVAIPVRDTKKESTLCL